MSFVLNSAIQGKQPTPEWLETYCWMFGHSDVVFALDDLPRDYVAIPQLGMQSAYSIFRTGFHPNSKLDTFIRYSTQHHLENNLSKLAQGYAIACVGGHQATDVHTLKTFCREHGLIAMVMPVTPKGWAGFLIQVVAVKNPLQAAINRLKAVEFDDERYKGRMLIIDLKILRHQLNRVAIASSGTSEAFHKLNQEARNVQSELYKLTSDA